jgi:anaerobic selenocysteine-containing dehydrogenase
MRVEFFAEAKLILIWGSNSIASNLHFWRHAQAAKRAGARLVCIDPRKTETADKCDEHIALLPGTDAALALALMHELIVHDWLDHDYIARHTVGWDALRERALQWPPSRAAQVCGVPEAQIVALAATTADQARGHPPELRHAARARRRQRGARGGLPAGADRRLARTGPAACC